MQNNSFFSKDNLKRKALPYLFTSALMAAITNLYLDTFFNIYTLAAMLITAAVYAMCDFMTKHKILAVPVYLLASFASGAAMVMLLMTAPSPIMIFEWFMTGGETVDTIPQFMLIVIIGFGFFISSVTYYFSHVIYRAAIFTLLSLIPCAIYVKAAQGIPLAIVSVIAALNVFIFIADTQRKHAENYIIKGGSRITAYVDFAVAAALIAILIPKPSVAPYYEKFEEFSNRFAFWGKANGISGEYMKHSGNADAYQEMENKLIYNITTDTPQYLKIQVFDKYDDENNWWTVSSRLGNGVKDWEINASHQNFRNLYKIYEQSGSSILEKLKNESLSVDDRIINAHVQAVDYPSQFVIAPQRTAIALLTDRPNETILRSDGYELFPSVSSIRSNGSFDLYYFDENFARDSAWLTSGLCDISHEEFSSIITEALVYFVYETDGDYEKDPLYKATRAFGEEAAQAENFAAEEYAPVSDEIQQLADEITAGLVYDHEKAAAIEQYFSSGFIYDLAFSPDKEYDTPEYFLLNSKRGTCSDFATAYCLLARGAGLTVRYVEGFTCDPSEVTAGLYEIYTEDAHAYPEVYIPGAGWIIYEPTPASNSASAAGSDTEENKEPDYLAIFIICLGVFISIAATVLLIILMPSIERKVFSLRVKRTAPQKGIIMIYGRLALTVEKLCGKETAVMTSAQLGEYIHEYTDLSADGIIIPFEKACYGGLTVEKTEITEADALLKQLTSAIKAVNKERRRRK